jgi:hypothetical protein
VTAATDRIDVDQVRALLHDHPDDLREQLASTERAIELLGSCGLPRLIDDDGKPTPEATGVPAPAEPPESKRSDAAIRHADPGPGAPSGRRRFTAEEKADIVDRAAELRSVQLAAEEAGVHANVVYRWKREGYGTAAS